MIKTYEPLHHKYRPTNFDELVGQDPIKSTLKQALTSDRIAPAYIFSGPRGTGKTSSARIFAKSLNCLKSEKATTDPCGQCELCKGISIGNALDVIEIDAASNTGVENIRELIERSRFSPAKARWKVYVIDECHMLSTAAFNALLKTLEEPPPQVVFILATTDPQRVIPTILSRCMRFDFNRISIQDLENHLSNIAKKEGISINENAISLIAKHSQGGLRDAESLLDQVSLLPAPITQSTIINLIGHVPEEELIQLATSLLNKNANSILNICESLINKGKEPLAILNGIASILRDLVVIKVSEYQIDLCNVSQENIKSLKELGNSFDLNQILKLQSSLKGSENLIRNSYQPKLWLEINLLGMLYNEVYDPNNRKNQALSINKTSNNSEANNFTKSSSSDFQPENKKNILEESSRPEDSQPTENISLNEVWKKVIAMLELPSTKMLLSQQARLINLNSDSAEIGISEKWINMIQSRKNLIEEAFFKARGTSTKVILVQQKDNLSNQKEEKKNFQPNERINKFKIDEKTDSNNLKDSTQSEKIIDTNSIDNKAKQFAEFFNGEIVDLSE